MTSLLEVENLHAYYGLSHILHGVTFAIAPGEIVSVVGRNGAGRSTLLKALMGMAKATGSVRFKEQEISGLKTFEIARHGIAYVPEERAVFPSLTVEQNLLLGLKSAAASRRTMEMLLRRFPQLALRLQTRADALSGGEQQMLSLCRSLMGEPALMLIDEPTEGLSPQMVRQVADFLFMLKEQGVAVLLVEQKMKIALEISQRVLVMGQGKIVFTGTPEELRDNPEISRVWLAL
ncbi:ABC transporter ATP-binding protein [Glaciimonas soli]|uniref:ATP-binding cassette domain-containing protein n=1 Tax=Glaciimonas soli TaxID=2590999 RepID=A0A843YLW3_9BURK|nr:ABC transporter ATP-binding protein [Glaciimonas soli]MQQ99899.1 ATP-binding cassette domain-containing protein [Glaciimonas soli]